MVKRILIAAAMAVALLGASATAAVAAPPGPGDKQCVPGQHGSPKPGFKAGACK